MYYLTRIHFKYRNKSEHDVLFVWKITSYAENKLWLTMCCIIIQGIKNIYDFTALFRMTPDEKVLS